MDLLISGYDRIDAFVMLALFGLPFVLFCALLVALIRFLWKK